MGRPFAFATCLVVASSGCLIGIDESLMNAHGGTGAGSDGGVGPGDGAATDGGDGAASGGGDGAATDGGPAAGGDGAVADPTLLGRWSFDEQDVASAKDSSGHGNDAALAGGPTYIPGHAGSALHFVSATGMSVARLGGAAFPREGTLSFWVRVTSGSPNAAGAYGLFDVEDMNRSHLALRPFPNGGDVLELEVCEATSGLVDEATAPMPFDAWTHVALTWSTGGNTVAYYSGPQGAALKRYLSGPLGEPWDTSGQFFRFGTQFTGDLDEVLLYSVVLDATGLAALP
jgi:Concanavalin A-like lectin/glucanases superfamily